jgi:hypothetical protein
MLQLAPLLWAALTPGAIEAQTTELALMTALSGVIALTMGAAFGWRRPHQRWLAELAAAPSLLLAIAATFIGIPAALYALASGSGPAGLALIAVPIAVFVVAAVTPLAGAYAGSRIGR